MSDWPWLFNDETLAEVVNRRLAEAEVLKADGSDALIARLSLDVPVYTHTSEVKRWITEPFVDRFDDEVPGGNLGIQTAFHFRGDATLLTVKSDTLAPVNKFMGEVVGNTVQLGHMRGDNDEAKLIEQIADRAYEFARILDHLRADAIPHNAELARLIREICAT